MITASADETPAQPKPTQSVPGRMHTRKAFLPHALTVTVTTKETLPESQAD